MHTATVIHGLKNGRKFGFPTANLRLDEEVRIDKGVYAVWVEVEEKTYKGMLYVGTRPTLLLNELTYEIHILDFQGNLYGKRLSFTIVQQIREEQLFDDTEALAAQLALDREAVREVLK
jgi:riboflavin kinase/FMN adenylyltransferase